MSDINIKRSHNLDIDTARSKLDDLKQKLDNKFGFDTSWDGSELNFNGKGTTGQIRLQSDSVEVDMKLGMLLKPLKGKIAQSIEQGLDKALA